MLHNLPNKSNNVYLIKVIMYLIKAMYLVKAIIYLAKPFERIKSFNFLIGPENDDHQYSGQNL